MFGDPAIIGSDGEIIITVFEEYDSLIYDEIIYYGYKEQRYYAGDIENLKNLRLAWTGIYANHAIDGEWSVDIDLTSIGGSISDSAELPDHPDFTSVSFMLSPMYFETEVRMDAFYPYLSFSSSSDLSQEGLESIVAFRRRLDEVVYGQKSEVVLLDGTRIEMVARSHFVMNDSVLDRTDESGDHSSGMTLITSRHILDGSFDIEDVAEVIILGVRFSYSDAK